MDRNDERVTRLRRARGVTAEGSLNVFTTGEKRLPVSPFSTTTVEGPCPVMVQPSRDPFVRTVLKVGTGETLVICRTCLVALEDFRPQERGT